MKKLDKEELDEFFKSGLTLPEIREVDEDWDRMKTILLKSNNRSRYSYYTILISSLAAVLLLIFSILFYSREQEGAENLKVNSVEKLGSGLPAEDRDHSDLKIESFENSSPVPGTVYPDAGLNPGSSRSGVLPGNLEVSAANGANNSAVAAPETADLSDEQVITLAELVPAGNSPTDPALASDTGTSNIRYDTVGSLSISDDRKLTSPAKSRFALALTLSPDVSGVKSMRKTSIGYSVGASLMYNITDKLGLETGIAYGSKAYAADFADYKPASSYVFHVKPYEVDADCEVLDLQLNLAYKLLNSRKYSMGFGAGVSSYLMLHESYTFRYADPGSRGPRRYNIENQNKHYLGVASLNLSYQRKLANNINLAFNPFLKLPLTDIGYGNIRLKTAGISIGVITDLYKTKK
ncbi:MAG: hypothetical protein WKF68_09955 [Daejeonella sp.]